MAQRALLKLKCVYMMIFLRIQFLQNSYMVTFDKDVQLIIYDVNNDDPFDRSQTSIEIVKLDWCRNGYGDISSCKSEC